MLNRRILLGVLLLSVVAGWVTPQANHAQGRSLLRMPLRAKPVVPSRPYVPGQLIVGLRSDSSLARQSRTSGLAGLRQHWGRLGVTAAIPMGDDAYQMTVAADADVLALARAIQADPAIRFAEPNYIYHATRTPNDPLWSFQYAPERINLRQAWDITTGGNGVVIAVIDTGVNPEHPDLETNLLPGYNFVEGNDQPDDDVFHGTFVAGVIAAPGDNGQGVAGVCWQCRILPIRSLGPQGGTSGSVAQGVRYAVDRGARVINMSLGGRFDSTLLREAVAYAQSKNVLIVAASGNGAEAGNALEYPAAYAGVLSVAATDSNDQIADFSTHNAQVGISAPGVNIASTSNEQDLLAYGAYDGTSFAAPLVAGTAGLMLSVNPSLSADQLRELLVTSVQDLGTPGRDEFYGAGRLDALRAVERATASAFLPVSNPQQADVAFFAPTGHTLRGSFRTFWETQGGLPVFGYPISEEFEETTAEGTFRVQYFERERFELHPENRAPFNVLLGRLGEAALLRTGRDWRRFPLGDPSEANCRLFEATGHTVCGDFRRYWETHGLNDPALSNEARSLQLLGLPLSEAQEETNSAGDTVLVQWFERARLELHPALPAGQRVLLGLLGNEIARPTFGSPPPSAPPAPAIDRCGSVPASINATITPANCVLFGAELEMTIRGFQPGESISYWLTDPTGRAVGTRGDPRELLRAEADGRVLELEFPTGALAPGTWFWVFQGMSSGQQAVIYFRIIDG